MHRLLPLSALFLSLFAVAFLFTAPYHNHLPPTEGDEGEHGMLRLRDAYFELRHRGAPGLDWRAANNRVMLDAYAARAAERGGSGEYADGYLRGAWQERGSGNQAGSMIAIDYVPETDNIYSVSDGGTLWRRARLANDWTNLNRDLRFGNRQLQVIPNGAGGQRILTTIGKRVWYSDDEGATFTQAGGWSFDDDWGWPLQLVEVRDANGNPGLYFTAITWHYGQWAPRAQLYYSADRGASFSLVHTFAHGEGHWLSLWSPYQSAGCYLLHRGTQLYTLDGPAMTLLNTNTALPADVDCRLRGHRAPNGAVTLYALTERHTVWRSADLGQTWELRGNTPSDAWDVGLEVSLSDPDKIFYGEVNCYRSIDGGASWQLVNEWWEYYGNVPGKLHADIMDIEFFTTAEDQEFALISNHGGMSISYNHLIDNDNIGMEGLNVSQYYDVRTDPLNPTYVYAGSQDQGYQRAETAVGAGFNLLGFTQIVSGDYGHMAFSNNRKRLWKQYPGGAFSYHIAPQTSSNWWDATWDLPGEHKPNVGWIVPVAEMANAPNLNKILVGGGNLSGGPGSYLIELTATTLINTSISATQDSFDFRANSNSGTALISAIAVSPLDGRRYVATDDGAFFRKNPGGDWQKASGFSGPGGFYLYGACILPSKLDAQRVWFAGSGYSNPAVWRSTDGGMTFTPMVNGLPATVVQELAASPDEQLLFAATDAGPYVYVAAAGKWYPIRGTDMPLQYCFSVEYVGARNLVRFGTFGRGIWDFALDNLALTASVNATPCGSAAGAVDLQVQAGLPPFSYAWSNGATTQDVGNLAAGAYTVTVTDANGFSREEDFLVQDDLPPLPPHSLTAPDSSCGTLPLAWQGSLDGSYELRYRQGAAADFTDVGNIGPALYYTLELDPANGLNYTWALRFVCHDGQTSDWAEYAGALQDCSTNAPTPPLAGAALRLSPNPASTHTAVWLEGDDKPLSYQLELRDAAGRIVVQQRVVPAASPHTLSLAELPRGLYFVVARAGGRSWVARVVKE